MIALNKLSRPRQSKLRNNIFVKEGVLGTCGLDTVERVEGVGVCGSNKNEVKKQGAARGVC